MNIAPDLEPLLYDVDLLDELPGNPRRGDVEAVKRSYERFGQRKPLVARRDKDGRATVVAGNHQLRAVRELGWEQVAVTFADDLTDDEARGFALADNRVGDLGGYDTDLLVDLIQSLPDDDDLLAATGYSTDDLDAMTRLDSLPDDVPPDGFEPISPDTIATEYRCPSCSYEWSGSPRPGDPLHEQT